MERMSAAHMAGGEAFDDLQPSIIFLLPVEVLVGHRELLQQFLVCL